MSPDAKPEINADDELIPAPMGKLLLISHLKGEIVCFFLLIKLLTVPKI